MWNVYASYYKLGLLMIFLLCEPALICISGHEEVMATMHANEGLVYLNVVRDVSHSVHDADEKYSHDGSGSSGDGWVEIWQQGHRLLLNTTEDEISFEFHGKDEIYMWASVFNSMGRHVGESNVVLVGHALPLSMHITSDGRDGQIWDPLATREWREGEHLEIVFEVRLEEGSSFVEIDAVILLINNQTHGMKHLGLDGQLGAGHVVRTYSYVHDGEMEPGVHMLQLAALEKGYSIPRVLSNIVWARVVSLDVPITLNSSQQFAVHPDNSTPWPEACQQAFSSCFCSAAYKIPPNRQVTEIIDAADECALLHCGLARGEGHTASGEGEAHFHSLARRPLVEQLDRHFSAVAAETKVAENLLRGARVLQLLGNAATAVRAYRAVLRMVGYQTAPTRGQCTYPGCKEISKDTCGLLNRLVMQHGRAWGDEALRGYMSHLDLIIPHAHAATYRAHDYRYPVSSIAFGLLTMASKYRVRADLVKSTWWRHVEKGSFYGDLQDDSLPIASYALLSDDTVDESIRELLSEVIFRGDYMSSMPKFFLTLDDLYRRYKGSDWFVIAGDDNFIVPQHLPPLLERLDSSKRIIAGGPIGLHVGVGRYPSGGSGLIFSKGYLEAAVHRLAPFAVSWIQGRGQRNLCLPCADIAFGVFSQDIGATVEELPCMHGMWPEYFSLHNSPAVPGCSSLVGLAPQPRVTCRMPASFHYIQPRGMELLDKYFFSHRCQT